MTENHEPINDPGLAQPEPATPPTPVGERFVDVIIAPAKAMAAVKQRPLWIVPFAALFVLLFLYTFTNVQVMMVEQSEMALEHASPQQAVGIEQQLEMFSDPPSWLRVVSGLGAGIMVTIISIMLPALLMHVFMKLSGGKGEMSQSLGVIFWSGLIAYGLRTILSWIIIVITGSSLRASLTAATLMSDPNPNSVGYVIAGLYGDPFMYWTLFVAVIGMAIVHEVDRVRAATVVLATYVLLSAIPVGMTLLGQAVGGMN